MAATTARILRSTISLPTLLQEIRYTISRLAASGLLASSLARFQTLRADWDGIQAKEISLHEQLSDALAQVDMADDALDDFARRFQQAVLSLTGQDKKAALHTHYFKKPLADLIRPTLSGQLTTMAGWVKSIKEPHTPQKLVDMVAELETLVQAGTLAQDRRDGIKLQIKQFREVGDRKQFIDRVNGERKELYGALAAAALSTPGLPSNLAAGYFKAAESGEAEPDATVESVSTEIKHLEETLQAKHEQLAALQVEEQAANEKAAQKAAKEKQIADLRKEMEAKAKALKALEEDFEG